MDEKRALWIKDPLAILADEAAGGVVVREGRIVELVPAGRRPVIENPMTFEAGAHVVVPGLINTHTHGAMNLLRGIADDLPLDRWLREDIFPAEAKNVSPGFVYDGTLLAALEMIEGGTLFPNEAEIRERLGAVARFYGNLIGVKYGEPFVVKEAVQVEDVVDLPVRSI